MISYDITLQVQSWSREEASDYRQWSQERIYPWMSLRYTHYFRKPKIVNQPKRYLNFLDINLHIVRLLLSRGEQSTDHVILKWELIGRTERLNYRRSFLSESPNSTQLNTVNSSPQSSSTGERWQLQCRIAQRRSSTNHQSNRLGSSLAELSGFIFLIPPDKWRR